MILFYTQYYFKLFYYLQTEHYTLMLIISVIFFSSLLLFTQAESILNNYGNGNLGKGQGNKVKGANNTWIGKSNSIKGSQNILQGDQNSITGHNNIIEGSNNVIGNVSPEKLIEMQNLMANNLQKRFSGLFKGLNFKSQPKAINTISENGNSSLSTQISSSQFTQKSQNINKIENQPIYSGNHKSDIQNHSSTHKIQKSTGLEDNKFDNRLNKNRLIFRTYGRYIDNQSMKDWINYSEQSEISKKQFCKRFKRCPNKKRNIFYSSIYWTESVNRQ